MSSDRNRILLDSIKRLLRRNALFNLKKIVAKTHAADLSRLHHIAGESEHVVGLIAKRPVLDLDRCTAAIAELDVFIRLVASCAIVVYMPNDHVIRRST